MECRMKGGFIKLEKKERNKKDERIKLQRKYSLHTDFFFVAHIYKFFFFFVCEETKENRKNPN